MLFSRQIECLWNEVEDLLPPAVLHVLVVVPQPVLPVQASCGWHGVDLDISRQVRPGYMMALLTDYNMVPHWPVGAAQVLGNIPLGIQSVSSVLSFIQKSPELEKHQASASTPGPGDLFLLPQ